MNVILLTCHFTAGVWGSFGLGCGFGRGDGILADYHYLSAFAFIFESCINMQV